MRRRSRAAPVDQTPDDPSGFGCPLKVHRRDPIAGPIIGGPHRCREGRDVEVILRHHFQRAESGQKIGAQTLLGLDATLERHHDRSGPDRHQL